MKYFKVQEFVSEGTYNVRGEASIQLIDNHLILFIEGLREALGRPITINNWHVGGEYSWRGLRTPDSPWYSTYSQHSFGRALDFDVKGMTAQEVREWIIEHRELEWCKCIGFLENDVNWVHVDCRFTSEDNDLWLWGVKTHKTEVFKREV